MDSSKKLKIEFEIEGNIPNWNSTEKNGGKVSLFTMAENSGTYYPRCAGWTANIARRTFRVILGDRADMRADGAARLITHRDLAGQYSMSNWGSERHQFEVTLPRAIPRGYILIVIVLVRFLRLIASQAVIM